VIGPARHDVGGNLDSLHVRLPVSADGEKVSVETGAGVTRRAAFVRFGGALAGGMMASACGVRVGDGGVTPVAPGSLVTGVPPAPSLRSPELAWG
jgi:hypothetical protein